jgi:hypothetical protein
MEISSIDMDCIPISPNDIKFPLRESWSSPYSGIHLKLIVAQEVNNFTAFYGTRRFIAVLTRVRH